MNSRQMMIYFSITIGLCISDVPIVLGSEPTRGGSGSGFRSPLSPAAERELVRVDDGLKMELVASEPQIESPVAMAFDEDGKLWVVEMRDYPNGPAKGEKPQGRIRLLEDRDGDGQYEHSTIFADELLFANGILPWKGGVIVTAAPHIVYLRDTDGDGKADSREVLYEGFAALNPQLRVSHPLLGIDNWVWVSNGLRGGQVVRAGRPDAKPIPLGGMDFRFDLVGDRAESVSGMGQYGNTFDDWGHRFVCDNRHHLRHIVLPTRYLQRNPNLSVPAVLQDVSEQELGEGGAGTPVHPLSKNWTTSNLHAGRFTAACGVFIYRGNLLPEKYRGTAFTCDPTGNLVHEEILRSAGATFKSRPAFEKKEFLASPEDWFRPVFLTHGPDGAMYLVDMYRAVIEHPEFMPTELKTRPDLLLGKDRGRIWRIVPAKHQSKAQRPALSKATIPELIALLGHDNAWHRTTAQRLLLERRDPAAVDPLRKALTSEKPLARLHAAWLLHSLGALEEATASALLKDSSAGIRENAVQLCEPLLAKSAAVQEALLKLADDTDPRVRFQVALSLGDWDSERILPALARIALQGIDDPWTRAAVASAVPTRAGALLHLLLKEEDSPARRALARELAVLVGSRRDVDEVSTLLEHLSKLSGKENERRRRAVVFGLTEGMGRRGTSLSGFLERLPKEKKAMAAVVDQLLIASAATAANDKEETTDRIEAIRMLSHAARDVGQPVLLKLLDDRSPEVKSAAVRSLATSMSNETAKKLLASWSSYSPSLRQIVADVMLQHPERTEVLLEEISAGRIKPRELDPTSTRRLSTHAKVEIREKATRLLKDALPVERKKVLEQYREATTLKGNALKGKAIFQQNCAACHRVADVGTRIGPDISDTRTKTVEQLLLDILDPNAAIDAGYLGYQVTTKAGKSFSGLISAETASSITLKKEQNQTEVILRQDIDEIQSSGVSLMPEGLEKNITVAQMADLLSFLKNWRYLDGTVPIGEGK